MYMKSKMSTWFDLSNYVEEDGAWKLETLHPAVRQAAYTAIKKDYAQLFGPKNYFSECCIFFSTLMARAIE